MRFDSFLNQIPKILKHSLPGEQAHVKMAPPERREMLKKLDVSKLNLRKAAVMMLVYPKFEQAHLSLILRNTYNGVHSSQIAFPGGKAEEFDDSYQQTALRETHEEIGVPQEDINVVRELTQIYIPPSNFMVFPFLGFCTETPTFIRDPAEVAGIIELPLETFLDDSIVVNQPMQTSYSKLIDVPSYKIHDQYVWGATAMMLSELKELLKST